MVAEGRDLGELGWEDSIKQDSQDFEPIPEGDYNVTIEKYDRSQFLSTTTRSLSTCMLSFQSSS